MVYPSTYNEMFAWVGIKKLRSFFELTNEQAEENCTNHCAPNSPD